MLDTLDWLNVFRLVRAEFMPAVNDRAKEIGRSFRIIDRGVCFFTIPVKSGGLDSACQYRLPVGQGGKADGVKGAEGMERVAFNAGPGDGGIQE